MPRWPRFFDASTRQETLTLWLGRLATLVMLALVAWLASRIFWSLNTPDTTRPATALPTDPQQAVQTLTAKHLFGVAPTNPTASSSMTAVDLRLNGTLAAQKEGQPAYAILAFEGKPPQVVREGAEIAPGITLERVMARQVEILRNGQKQTLSLPESGKGGPGQPPGLHSSPIAMPGALPAATPQFHAQQGSPLPAPIPNMQPSPIPEPRK